MTRGKIVALHCTSLIMGGLIALGQATPPSTTIPSGSMFIERLRSVAENTGTDCGTTTSTKPDDAVASCGQKAFDAKHPFFLAYVHEGKTVEYGYGLASDAAGNVFAINYQFFPPFPGIAPNRHTQVSGANHLRITECIKPITLAKTKRGLLACITPINQTESDRAAHQKPVKTTLCAILENPPAWNNKLVRIRGHYSGNFEYSMLGSDGCQEALWLEYGGGSGPPNLAAYVGGGARPGSEDTDGKLILPIPITLVRDSKFDQFEEQVEAMAKADDDSFKKNSKKFLSHCVTSTFTGRIDAVSPEVHEFRKSHPHEEHADSLGFGQMGLFEGQFILQSVDDDAVLGICGN